MTLIRANKKQPCPVCNSATKGCSHDTSTGVYLCRGENINEGFAFTKVDATGVWGLYVVKEDKEFSLEERREFARKIAAERKEREAKERARLESLLTIEERDRKINHLLSQLTLSLKHKEELLSRGLTTKQIQESGFKSIKNKQTFKDVDGLAGFNPNGLYIGASGLICPIRDTNSRLLGFQIKTDNKDLGKYIWTRNGDTTAHLRNGELPLNVVPGNSSILGICEGILKPVVASKRHNLTLLGASGNTFYPQQLKGFLSKFNPLSSRPVVIFPDAGWLTNSSVYLGVKRNAEMIQELGYQVMIADWGHWLSKPKLDIDEIPNLEDVKYLDCHYIEAYYRDRKAYIERFPITAEEYKLRFSIPSLFTDMVKYAKSLGKTGKHILSAPIQESNWFNYIPGTLPQPGTVMSVEFDCGTNKIYEEACRAGYKFILDISQTGAGKTYGASRVEPEKCFVFSEAEKEQQLQRKLWYLTQQSRNPNIDKLESDFTELPARTLGYDLDHTKLTPLGNPYRHHSKQEKPDTPSNCYFANKFHIVRENLSEADICKSCKFASQCRNFEGDGYGFKAQFRHALKASKIRANPQSLTTAMVSDKSIAIVDEYNQSVAWEQSLSIDLLDVKRMIGSIVLSENSAALEFIPALKELSTLLTQPVTHFGLDTTSILKQLSTVDFDAASSALTAISEEIEKFNLDVVIQEKNSSGAVLRQLVTKNWLTQYIEVVSGKNPHSSLRLTNGKLTITLRNQRVLDVFNKLQTVIFQDATGSRLDLALKLGCSVDDILVIRKLREAPTNIKIHHVTGMGLVSGKKRSNEMTQRVKAIRNAVNKRHRNSVGFIDSKKYAKEGDLHHFVDARGSNRFQDKKAVVAFGVPYLNLSSLQAQYETYTGERLSLGSPNLQLYINAKVTAEIIQEVGRLRGNRRKSEELHFYLCADVDVSFLEELGYNVVTEAAIDLDFEAGDRQQKARLVVLDAFKKLVKAGKKLAQITTSDIAEFTDTDRSNVSHLASKFGGFEGLKRLIGCLVYKSEADYSQEVGKLDDIDIFLANSYLPDVLQTDFDSMAAKIKGTEQEIGSTLFERVMSNIPIDTVGYIIAKCVEHLPYSDRYRFQELCEDLVT